MILKWKTLSSELVDFLLTTCIKLFKKELANQQASPAFCSPFGYGGKKGLNISVRPELIELVLFKNL